MVNLLARGKNERVAPPTLQALPPQPVKGVDKPVEIFTLAS
jgi:hypothetical protein